MRDTEALLAAFDAQARAEPSNPPPGIRYERDGPVLRMVGTACGFISAPPDTGLRGAELDELIARQRDYFAGRGEPVEWKTYAHDQPPDLVARLRAAGFAAEDMETVVVGRTEQMATPPVLPDGVALRQVTADADMRRIAGMESAVWDLERLVMTKPAVTARSEAWHPPPGAELSGPYLTGRGKDSRVTIPQQAGC